MDYFGGKGLVITPVLDDKDAKVKVQTYVTNKKDGQEVHVVLKDAEGLVVAEGTSTSDALELEIKNVHRWHGRKDPYLYTCEAELVEDGKVLDAVSSRFGCRTFEVHPENGFILNGEEYPLRGVSRHQDRIGCGNALSKEHHDEDMELICEVGATTIRLAHYQHDQYVYDLCDEKGMVVWAEIPYISNHMATARENTITQMKELVVQNYNHPSIVVWGLSNEITIGGANNPDLIENHRILNDLVHSMDKTRLTTMAAVSMLEPSSPMNNVSDILSYNHYFGWYGGEAEDNAEWFDKFHKDFPKRCFGISEYGCEAILRWHTSKPEMGDYSEEYQAHYHHVLLETFRTRPYLWATHVWNMFDFAVDMRNEGGVQGRNNKGLVTIDRKTKKDSFYLYKAYWTTEPMVHLAKKRYVYRCEDETEVLIYSNLPEVSLYVDGKLFETKACDKVAKFIVPLTKSIKLTAVAGDLKDTSVVKKVKKPYKDYALAGSSASVVNWFDKDGNKLNLTFDENYFSIKDKIKNIQADPEASKVLQGFIDAFVAEAKKMGMELPAGMMKMMGSFSIERISKLAGDRLPAEAVAKINEGLQKCKK